MFKMKDLTKKHQTGDIKADKDLINSIIHKINLMHQQKAAREAARGYLPHVDKIACRYKVKI